MIRSAPLLTISSTGISQVLSTPSPRRGTPTAPITSVVSSPVSMSKEKPNTRPSVCPDSVITWQLITRLYRSGEKPSLSESAESTRITSPTWRMRSRGIQRGSPGKKRVSGLSLKPRATTSRRSISTTTSPTTPRRLPESRVITWVPINSERSHSLSLGTVASGSLGDGDELKRRPQPKQFDSF